VIRDRFNVAVRKSKQDCKKVLRKERNITFITWVEPSWFQGGRFPERSGRGLYFWDFHKAPLLTKEGKERLKGRLER